LSGSKNTASEKAIDIQVQSGMMPTKSGVCLLNGTQISPMKSVA
jgi:hypothetical protein